MGVGTLAALTLVVVCGSPIFADWVNSNTTGATAGGLFFRTLAWPHWSFDGGAPARDLLAQDLKAILVVVLIAAFLTLVAGAELGRIRGGFAAFILGWTACIFAGALAGFVAALFSAQIALHVALVWATAGASYGFLAGWIIGLAQLIARRS
ncbi:hypothetical protein [Planosporangium flavigriseum]|uniref:hypothetical protein n=1 Tax=Planosporangium flavigriseum TaxID=373681 RepID=UPI001EF209CF|nr:hypothetical protein [Planosporangium flavigriseum]